MNRIVYLAAATAIAVGACSSHPKPPAATPAATSPSVPQSLPLPGCPAQALPSGFTLDAARSGNVTPAQYSSSGDMQAAMLYDKYQGGVRSVYTNLQPSKDGDTNLVVECVAMQFGSPADASRFVAAYKALREQAGPLAQAVPPATTVGTTTLQYQEHNQGFAGYHITSTDVVELAAVTGDRFYTVAVAGPTPSSPLAVSLLRSMVGQP